MKLFCILIALLAIPGVVRGQSSGASSGSSASDGNLAEEVKALREALLQTQKQMAAQQREIEALKAEPKNVAGTSASPSEPSSNGGNGAADHAAPYPAESETE